MFRKRSNEAQPKKRPPMKVICMEEDCGKHISGPRSAKEISHGLCDDCFKIFKAEAEAAHNNR